MRIISPKQVAYKTNVSLRQQGRLIERGQFPKPIPLYEGGRRIGFVEAEIDEWIAARVIAARVGAAPQAEPPAAAENRAEPAAKNGHETPRAGPPAGRRQSRRAQPPPRRPQRGAAPKTPI
jgi:predicted DNA-binding transcriptional regulator AlpA